MAKESERKGLTVDPKDVDKTNLSGLTTRYDVYVRLLVCLSDWSTRDWIERAVNNPCSSKLLRPVARRCYFGTWHALQVETLSTLPSLPTYRSHTAQGCKEYMGTKRAQKASGQLGGNGYNGGFDDNSGGGCNIYRGEYKHDYSKRAYVRRWPHQWRSPCEH